MVSKLMPDDLAIEKFVDLPDLLARVENDRELLEELFAMFKEELPVLQDALHEAMNISNLPQTVTAAHTLKGMLANMSMKHGASLAAHIEAAARAGDSPEIQVRLAELDSEIAALSVAIEAFVSGQ
jgi:HPt (histidine-containing phosphotransfer) domain-containing protein